MSMSTMSTRFTRGRWPPAQNRWGSHRISSGATASPRSKIWTATAGRSLATFREPMSIFLMPRFFVDKPLQPDDVMPLPDDVVRHVLVLRLQPGDSIVLFNGEGKENTTELVEVERRLGLVKSLKFR